MCKILCNTKKYFTFILVQVVFARFYFWSGCTSIKYKEIQLLRNNDTGRISRYIILLVKLYLRVVVIVVSVVVGVEVVARK